MATWINRRGACVAAMLGLAAAPAFAQSDVPLQDTVHFFTYENDARYNTDRLYTSGVQFSTKRSRDERGRFARAWTGALCRIAGCENATLLTSQTNVGQLIYTPQDITVATPQPYDRPWAGLLYYEQVYAFLSADQRTLTTLTAQAGLTGPASLAEPAQKLLHRLLDRPRPEGWSHQIGGSLAVLASVEQRRAVDALSTDLWRGVRLNTAAYWRVAGGTLMNYGAVGMAVVIGKDLPLVSPPPPGIGNKMRPSARSFDLTSCMASWVQCTAFASVEVRYVGQNLFLDGRPWRDDPSVRRRRIVHDVVAGLRLDLPETRTASHGPWFVQLKVTRRSSEFKGPVAQPRRHVVAGLTIGTEF